MKRIPPVVFVLAVIAVGLALAALWNALANPFQFTSGPQSVSLVRGYDDVVTYTVTYNGAGPAVVESAYVILKGQILHVQVVSVDVVAGESDPGRRLSAEGKLDPGQQITLQPGDAIQFRLSLQGKDRGGNYLGGFRLIFRAYGLSLTQDAKPNGDYVILVN